MKQGLIWGLVIVISLILQSTILPSLAYHGIHADLLLIVVISSSLLMGKSHGAVIGFSAGLLQDLSSGAFFGMHTFSKMLLGYVFGMAEQQVFKENFFLPVMAMFFATLANAFLTSLLMLLLGYRFDVLHGLTAMLGPLLVYNVILSFPVHKLIFWLRSLVNKEH